MIPEIVLDTEEFTEILEDARGKIAGIYPQWTDYNYHDPGITMLELFAWLKEGQQFYMDQTGEEQEAKFLKLLGTRRKTKEPAKAMLTIDVEKDTVIPKGTKFYADDICFETTCQNYMIKEDIEKCFYADSKIIELADHRQLGFGHKLKFSMFGNAPKPGDTFYIGFQDALPEQMEISIYFELYAGYEVKRNWLLEELTVPFVHFVVEYLTKDGWQEVYQLKDDTYGFLQSGQIYFSLADQMIQNFVYGELGYYVRIRITSGEYDVPPVMESFAVNAVQTEQVDQQIEHEEIEAFELDKEGMAVIRGTTYLSIYGLNDIYIEKDKRLYEAAVVRKYMEEEQGFCSFVFQIPEHLTGPEQIHIVSYENQSKRLRTLGYGNGYPSQKYDLGDEAAVYERLALMVREEDSDAFTIWNMVNDFAGSSPEDRHFTFDSRDGTVRFGDGRHGLPPEGEIRLIAYARSFGKNGKVKKNQITEGARELDKTLTVTNQQDSNGGKQEESMEESFLRIQKELFHPKTAVTYEDYENYILKTPGLMIAGCKVLSPEQVKEIFPYYDESAITAVVKPYAKQMEKSLIRKYWKNILAYLEHYRMAGTSIYLIRPEYIQFELYVEVAVKPHYLHGEEDVKEAVEKFFRALSEELGACVRYSRLYGVLDTLPCVKRMHALSFEVRGTGVKHLPDGSVQIPPNGVVELKHAEYQFTLD